MPNPTDERQLKKTQRQISKEYNDALMEAVRKSRDFLKRADDVDSGKIEPPAAYTTEKQIAAWKEGYLRRAAEQVGVVTTMQEEMAAAGIRTRKRIEDVMVGVYQRNAGNVERLLGHYDLSGITDETRGQIATLLYGSGRVSTFTKISLEHLGTGANASRRMQRELAEGLRRGEGQDQLIARLRRVTGMEYNDAKLVLRTEMTHVESLAQNETAMAYYRATGRMPRKRWRCMFHNSRDSHMQMDGQIVYADDPFILPSGSPIMYPGDSSAGASEVCNCQCWMEILPPEDIDDGDHMNTANGEDDSPERALKGDENNGIIQHEIRKAGSADVQSIAKLDFEIYKCVTPDISTDDVVITDKQVQHIFQGHPQKEHAHVMRSLEATIAEPDYILEDSHAEHRMDTAIVMKQFQQEYGGYRVILRLATSSDPVDQKNSVITAFFISEKKWNKYLRNKTILYKRE